MSSASGNRGGSGNQGRGRKGNDGKPVLQESTKQQWLARWLYDRNPQAITREELEEIGETIGETPEWVDNWVQTVGLPQRRATAQRAAQMIADRAARAPQPTPSAPAPAPATQTQPGRAGATLSGSMHGQSHSTPTAGAPLRIIQWMPPNQRRPRQNRPAPAQRPSNNLPSQTIPTNLPAQIQSPFRNPPAAIMSANSPAQRRNSSSNAAADDLSADPPAQLQSPFRRLPAGSTPANPLLIPPPYNPPPISPAEIQSPPRERTPDIDVEEAMQWLEERDARTARGERDPEEDWFGQFSRLG